MLFLHHICVLNQPQRIERKKLRAEKPYKSLKIHPCNTSRPRSDKSASLLVGHLPVALLPSVVERVQGLAQSVLGLDLQVLLVKLQSCHSVLNGVMSDSLDLFPEKMVRQKLERDHPVVRQVVEMHFKR